MHDFPKGPHSTGRKLVSPGGILWFSVVLWLGTVGIGAAMLGASRMDAYRHAVRNASNLGLILERDIQRSIDLYDLSLRAVAEGAADPRVMALPPDLRRQVLFDRAATGRYLGAITATAADGRVLADSGPASGAASGAAPGTARLHFDLGDAQLVRDGLYIGRPTTPAGGGPLAIPLGRALTGPDGRLQASIVGSLGLDYFKALISGLTIGVQGSVAVFETDGTLLARLPTGPARIGGNYRDAEIFRRLMSSKEGHFVGTPSLDGVQRLYVYRHLSGLPLVVSVAPDVDSIFHDWWARVAWFGVLILVFTIIEAIGMWLFVRELRRRQRAEAALERLVRHDPLTGIENRTTLEQVLAREWKRALREGTPLSLLFIDIDAFKAYNDHYGHPAGDVALKSAATLIASCVRRPGDHVARYGGEEFVVVLPNTDLAGARTIAEKMRATVAEAGLEHARGPAGVLTVSVGVSSSSVAAVTDEAALVRTADNALYCAKQLGRNRVALATQSDGGVVSPRGHDAASLARVP